MSVSTRATQRHLLRASLILIVLALSVWGPGCGDASDAASPTSDSEFVGYWRSVAAEGEWGGPKLIKISLSGDSYTIDAPQMYTGRQLTLNGDRLELREQDAAGEFAYLRTFQVRPSDGLLVWGDYFAEPFTGEPPLSTLFERATGLEAELAAELENWRANDVVAEQLEALGEAIGLWRAENGGHPSEEEMRPDGAFWQWAQAPELTNAFTGAPFELGDDLGEFSYELSQSEDGRSCTISIHLFGGGDASSTEWVAL